MQINFSNLELDQIKCSYQEALYSMLWALEIDDLDM